MAGIYFQSSGGAIRANLITGHTDGIYLANSSIVLGQTGSLEISCTEYMQVQEQ